MREERFMAVYILSNRYHGTLYIGVTGDLVRRMHEHRHALTPGFASKYGLKRLVWYEQHEDFGVAVQRETSLKRWLRQWKIDLIETQNPSWDDLYPRMLTGMEG